TAGSGFAGSVSLGLGGLGGGATAGVGAFVGDGDCGGVLASASDGPGTSGGAGRMGGWAGPMARWPSGLRPNPLSIVGTPPRVARPGHSPGPSDRFSLV